MHTFLNVERYRVQLAFGLCLIFFSIFITFAQETEFVTRSGTNLVLNDRPFYAVGVNCYYLQNLAAYGDTFHIDEVFQEAKQIDVTVIRTWGFFDHSNSTNPAVIQYLPKQFNESGLKALDLVIAKAREYSIRLIIPLVNNWEDYGGMNQYVRWYAESFPKQNASLEKIEQRIITGAEGRYYRYRVSGSYTHDDFYSNTTIVQWYKEYISTILNRTNTITKIKYKNGPVVLAW
ncbi:MAG: hypothetical protein HY800_08095 [Ignavibacteriales bacterium]|nr:hypothetical protein [Ignavibacteriales bacterium]